MGVFSPAALKKAFGHSVKTLEIAVKKVQPEKTSLQLHCYDNSIQRPSNSGHSGPGRFTPRRLFLYERTPRKRSLANSIS